MATFIEFNGLNFIFLLVYRDNNNSALMNDF